MINTLYVRSDDSIAIDPSVVQQWVSSVHIYLCFQYAIVTVLIYDTVTTMDKEIKYFWTRPFKTVHAVYFANRYIGILGAISLLFFFKYGVTLPLCNFAEWTQNLASWTVVILIDYILLLRVLALYSQDKRLSYCLGTFLALVAMSRLGLNIYGTYSAGIAVGQLTEDITVCGVTGVTLSWHFGVANWSIPLVYGLILMGLALYKATDYWKMSAGFKGFTLVRVLIQDQIIYFMLVISCCVFNILVFKINVRNEFLANVLDALGNPSFLCILGSRILVNLKEAGERGVNAGTSYRLKTMSNMEFA